MSTRVFVGGLTYKVRERDLEKFFRKYGRIREVSMKNGYAFVEFDDHRDAEDAVYELNGKDLMGDRITVEKARGTPRGSDRWRDRGRGPSGPPRRRDRDRDRDRDREPRGRDKYGPPTRTEYRVRIENLSSRCSWQDLKDYMRKAGEVTYADAHKQTPNEGVVEFASFDDMKTAIEKLDGTEINGRKIHIVEVKKDRQSRSHSRNHSKSRSHSRSNSPKSISRSRSRSRNGRSRSHSKENDSKRSKSRSRSNDRD